ncbi:MULTISPECIES: transposase family protein [Cyanophyceae]|uniref:transposase family protein n=1 Tax=Cyanophyceae TaxID=3028117 RepID=UPI0018F003C1
MLTLEYWREYRTLFHIAKNWGVHESTAQRTVKRTENMLIKSIKFGLPSQREMVKNNTEIEVVIVNVAETEIERPKKNRSPTTATRKSVIG